MLNTIWSTDERITGDDVTSLALEHGVPEDRPGECRLGIWWNRVDLNGLDEGLEWTLFNDGTLEFWTEITRDTQPGDGLPEVEDRLESILELFDWLCARPETYSDIVFCVDVIESKLTPPAPDNNDWEQFVGDEEDEHFAGPLQA